MNIALTPDTTPTEAYYPPHHRIPNQKLLKAIGFLMKVCAAAIVGLVVLSIILLQF